MKVSELIQELKKYPPDHDVHLDISIPDDGEWEGERVVRLVAGVRIQQGSLAVAIDGTKHSA
jgi:hypothetical protein